MGIQDLGKLLRKHCPHIYEEIHISEYSFKKVAIDISLYLCKYKAIAGERWLTSFVNLIACLRKNEVHCLFVYDGIAPADKDAERQQRKDDRAKLEERVYKLEEALDEYHNTNIISDILIELYKKTIAKINKAPKRLMGKNAEKKDHINMDIVEDAVKKMRGHILDIKQEDFDLTKKLFDILNVPYVTAPSEAETMCADLCKRGIVDAALSEDTDVLAYGSPIFLLQINIANSTCFRIKYDTLLEGLQLTTDEFLDVCIMCGTDYNNRVPKVGPETIYKYIKKYSTIESVAENTKIDIGCLKHVRNRELFRQYKKVDTIKITYCGSPNFKMLQEFIVKNNININMKNLENSFIHSTAIVYEDEEISNSKEEIKVEEEIIKNVSIKDTVEVEEEIIKNLSIKDTDEVEVEFEVEEDE